MGIAPDQDICYGSSTHITGFGGSTYQWRTLDNSSVFTGESPLIVPTDTTTYYVTITDINGCMRKDTVTVNVVPIVDLKFDIERIYDCQTRPYIKLTNVSELKEGEEAMFLFGDGSSSDEKEVIHTYERDDIYTISLQATKEFCVYEHSRSLPVVTLKVPNVITPGAEDGLNDAFRLVYGDPELPKNGLTVQLKIVNRWGVKVFESNDYKDDWRGADLDAGVYFFEIELGEFKCKGWIHLIK